MNEPVTIQHIHAKAPEGPFTAGEGAFSVVGFGERAGERQCSWLAPGARCRPLSPVDEPQAEMATRPLGERLLSRARGARLCRLC